MISYYIYIYININIFENIIQKNSDEYLKYIVTPLAPYYICNHYYSTEIHEYINKYNAEELPKTTNDLLKNKNVNIIKEGGIVQVSVDLFYKFIKEILPILPVKIILITSKRNLPQLHRNQLTDYYLNHKNIILWVSQTPIYKNNNKYMAFPYGIDNLKIKEYMKFVKKNYINSADINNKDTYCYNSHIVIHNHLPINHIRRNPIFSSVNKKIPYENFLNNILKSMFTISLSGDRDDCYRHYECIGLNSIPISNINYKEIFQDNMIYSNINEIIEIINNNKKFKYYNIDRNILTIQYWLNIILERYKNNIK